MWYKHIVGPFYKSDFVEMTRFAEWTICKLARAVLVLNSPRLNLCLPSILWPDKGAKPLHKRRVTFVATT